MFLDDIVSPLNELSKDQLKNYIRANAADAVQRTSSDSFKSGAAGDRYNKSAFDTPVDRKRERGMDRALNKLAREAANPAQQAAVAVAMKKAGKKPKQVDEAGTRAGALNTAQQLYKEIQAGKGKKQQHEIDLLQRQLDALARKYQLRPEEYTASASQQQGQQQQRQQPPPPPPGGQQAGRQQAGGQQNANQSQQNNWWQQQYEKHYGQANQQAQQADPNSIWNPAWAAKQQAAYRQAGGQGIDPNWAAKHLDASTKMMQANQADMNKAFQSMNAAGPWNMPGAKMAAEETDKEQKPAGWGEFPPKQEITIVPPKKLKSGETYQDQNKYWQSQGQAPIYKTNEDHADQQRKIFKKNGKPVGEVGIDRESSPGNGQWYMTCYGVVSYGGYNSYEEAVAELKHCLKQGVAEGLNEFAPPGDGDGGDDGFDDEMLKRLAAQWWNGDEDPRVERTLAAAGWEIGQDEGSYDNGGAFVVQAGDVNGNSYMSWPAEELEQGVAEGGYSRYDNNRTGFSRTGREDDEYHVPDPVETKYNIKVNGQVINDKPFANRASAVAWAKQAVASGKLDPKNAKLSPINQVNELSTDKLAKYKTAAGADASAADKRGNYERGNKRFRGIVRATIKQGDNDAKKHKDVAEGFDDVDPVTGAITRRILSQRLDLLTQYGPELVGAAVDNVADYVGDVEEIGSSDVSGWVVQVERMLRDNPPEAFSEEWSKKYKSSINCSHPKGFSQKAHCAGKKKHTESIEMEMVCEDCGMCETHGDTTRDTIDEACWKGYHKEGMKTMFGKRYPNCVKNKNESLETYVRNGECPGCGGAMVAEGQLNEKQDACYHKVKSRYKVWPSAYASGALVQCRKKGAANWGNSNESITQEEYDQLDENLKDWFGKEKWVRMDTKGNIKGPCARGSSSEGKPKCLPQAKAHALGKKGRASAAQKKRRQDPNPERRGKAINVSTRVKESYWNKLQYDRNTKIASLVNELEESIKDIK
jgi:hypothetical protein